MKKDIMRIPVFCVLLALVISLFYGCGGAGASSDNAKATADSGAGYYTGAAAMAEELGYEAAEADSYAMDSSSEGAASAELLDENTGSTDRKLIRNMNLSLETTDFDALLSTIEEQAEALGGYLEENDLYGNSYGGLRSAYICARIPADKLDAFEASVTGAATVLSRNVSVTDVTLSYSDLESHIASLKIEQETLNGLLEEAKDIETVLAIQTQLTDIRYELESYASQLKIMENQVSYSTVYINIDEVAIPTATENDSFASRVSSTFRTSMGNLANGAVDFLVWFLGNIVSILIVVILIVIVVVVLRRLSRFVRTGKRKKEEKKEQTAQAGVNETQKK